MPYSVSIPKILLDAPPRHPTGRRVPTPMVEPATASLTLGGALQPSVPPPRSWGPMATGARATSDGSGSAATAPPLVVERDPPTTSASAPTPMLEPRAARRRRVRVAHAAGRARRRADDLGPAGRACRGDARRWPGGCWPARSPAASDRPGAQLGGGRRPCWPSRWRGRSACGTSRSLTESLGSDRRWPCVAAAAGLVRAGDRAGPRAAGRRASLPLHLAARLATATSCRSALVGVPGWWSSACAGAGPPLRTRAHRGSRARCLVARRRSWWPAPPQHGHRDRRARSSTSTPAAGACPTVERVAVVRATTAMPRGRGRWRPSPRRSDPAERPVAAPTRPSTAPTTRAAVAGLAGPDGRRPS